MIGVHCLPAPPIFWMTILRGATCMKDGQDATIETFVAGLSPVFYLIYGRGGVRGEKGGGDGGKREIKGKDRGEG